MTIDQESPVVVADDDDMPSFHKFDKRPDGVKTGGQNPKLRPKTSVERGGRPMKRSENVKTVGANPEMRRGTGGGGGGGGGRGGRGGWAPRGMGGPMGGMRGMGGGFRGRGGPYSGFPQYAPGQGFGGGFGGRGGMRGGRGTEEESPAALGGGGMGQLEMIKQQLQQQLAQQAEQVNPMTLKMNAFNAKWSTGVKPGGVEQKGKPQNLMKASSAQQLQAPWIQNQVAEMQNQIDALQLKLEQSKGAGGGSPAKTAASGDLRQMLNQKEGMMGGGGGGGPMFGMGYGMGYGGMGGPMRGGGMGGMRGRGRGGGMGPYANGFGTGANLQQKEDPSEDANGDDDAVALDPVAAAEAAAARDAASEQQRSRYNERVQQWNDGATGE